MNGRTCARVAGFTYLLYIAVALPGTLLLDRATKGEGTVARLASIAQHATDLRVSVLLSLLSCFIALVLAMALYGLTRDEDRELAVVALCCRVGEGVVIAAFTVPDLGLLWLGTSGTAATAPDAPSAYAIGTLLFKVGGWGTLIAATLFAAGSTVFSWLLLRGRMIPVVLAGLGVLASVLLVTGLPLQLTGLLGSRAATFMWLPMLVFELTLAVWLLVKGVAPPRRQA